ncbi:MAG: nicotinate-nucleotide adenylyltransferase [Candidatus Marinimicrobia bacterium]|nr:nicotinate-nucleotide adenylyltransferase [Candidatus Neomarinimicrobiota bacterium]
MDNPQNKPDAARPRIGIFGGTFNPVHLGHLIAAQDALESAELDQILFMPCPRPVHKPAVELTNARHRVNMLHLALEGETAFEVSTWELDHGAPCYALDTVTGLAALHPDADLYFLVGADMLLDLPNWRQVTQLLDRCRICPIWRPGQGDPATIAARIDLPPPWPDTLARQMIRGHQVGIASRDLRRRIAEGQRIRYLVPPEVEMYISEHNLYRGYPSAQQDTP